MFDKLKKSGWFGGSIPACEFDTPIGSKPSEKTIYQYRQNFGVNFGSLFVLEKYIYGDMFIENTGVELDAIKKCVKKDGVDKTREKLENHWNTYCTDDDWRWLKSKGVQSVRIPIGYWMVDGAKFADGTSFDKLSKVYVNAWNILIEKYIKKAAQYHISILVDLHAVPKGANTGDHSGEKFTKPKFWDSSKWISHTCTMLSFMAKELAKYDNVSAIQVVNEAPFYDDPSYPGKYYRNAIQKIREENTTIPIVISDGWWPGGCVNWLNKYGGSGKLGVVIDDHVYRCFSDEDKQKCAGDLISGLEHTVLPDNVGDQADFIIGEYSCVLDSQTWDKTQDDRSEKVKEYGRKQVETFKTKADTGCYFWCYKFQYGDGGEWGFRPMVESGSIPTRNESVSLPSDGQFQDTLNNLLSQHEQYWNSQNPNEHYEHWRYKEGFTTAWQDCMEFAKFDNSRIGRICAWKEGRRNQHIQSKGSSGFLWEWDQGFQKALDIFRQMN